MLADGDYERLLRFRVALRRFLERSETEVRARRLTPAQHQLLLAIAGHPEHGGPTIGDVAGSLLIKHHSAVGLVDRAEAAKMVKRVPDPDDHRVVRLRLTALGRKHLDALSVAHLDELRYLAPALEGVVRTLAEHPA
jgi:DNA-binding MarR family transcriptional regulator